MLAARFHAPGRPLALDDVPVPEPAPDEVRVRVGAAGVCGTELHFTDGLYAPSRTPMTLGHEAAGTVDAVGSAVTGWAEGDRVAVYYYLFCGSCRWCLRGRQNLCLAPRGVLAFAADGAFAEQLVVPAHCLVRLPDELSFEAAAPLCCAGTTAVHALTEAGVEPGDVVVVLGAGGVGLAAVQEARRRGGVVVAVSRDDARRSAARTAGAVAAVSPAELAETVARLSGGQGADVVVELAGVTATLELATAVLGRRGRLVLVGYSADALTVSPLGMVVAEQRVIASVGNTLAELEQAVSLAAAGQLVPPVAGRMPLTEVNEALDRLRAGDVAGRLVLTP
ncbi:MULTISPECIES: alcohol dehydrogenase catalytic domain-containing protein [unclassified Modestobacter]|uniref:alcohol dehydrogenase catalytic domain-containing protein n=1 Tax=unclassified Modestobacter TaxID=2643866 RepID=UPI0022AB29F2|nr:MULTISPECIES: alcohol dehydrogenase catalytic domain-containing protein [unclassified Modestobacter]MCZ2826586.1 alcohol dehydrogenase catalytic domain-containing protein [Modestobacter sp. VKM Ac-2981]MCZ2854966.1 alcohol dehydrogenase catalytic domain-containing protein [Modestobacter sp. VKM Ac-2982]